MNVHLRITTEGQGKEDNCSPHVQAHGVTEKACYPWWRHLQVRSCLM